jgi:hypothetical protein
VGDEGNGAGDGLLINECFNSLRDLRKNVMVDASHLGI